MSKALLAVSFGTAYAETRKKTIEAVERDLSAAFPERRLYTAWTSGMILRKLKKLGEETTEVVIASKNAEEKEVVYEIADVLYHTMVLMAEKGINWDTVLDELARRH